MHFDYAEIGRRIREERRKRGWSQAKLEELTGISTSHISSIERGTCEFSARYFAQLSDAFGVSIDYLRFGESVENRASVKHVILHAVSDCDQRELQIIADQIVLLKGSLRKFA